MLMSVVHAVARSCVDACVFSEETEIEWIWTGDGEELRRVERRGNHSQDKSLSTKERKGEEKMG